MKNVRKWIGGRSPNAGQTCWRPARMSAPWRVVGSDIGAGHEPPHADLPLHHSGRPGRDCLARGSAPATSAVRWVLEPQPGVAYAVVPSDAGARMTAPAARPYLRLFRELHDLPADQTPWRSSGHSRSCRGCRGSLVSIPRDVWSSRAMGTDVPFLPGRRNRGDEQRDEQRIDTRCPVADVPGCGREVPSSACWVDGLFVRTPFPS